MANNTVIGLSSIATIEAITAGSFTGVTISGSGAADTLNFTGVTLTGIGRIDGGAGNDTITGPAAAATVAGGAGDDTITGGAGNDTFQVTGTGDGFDAITGGAGTDTIQAVADNTIIGLRSLATVEAISAGTFANVSILGSAAADTLSFATTTLTGIVRIDGGAGNDIITGGIGNDTLIGGAGSDTLNGGAGIDTVDYSYLTTGFTLSLASIAAQTLATGDADTLSNFENVTGGTGNDVLIGTTADNVLNGGAGNDTLTGGLGNDTLTGGLGTDTAVFAGVSTTYSVSTLNGVVRVVDNAPTVDGNDGTDIISGIEQLLFKNSVTVGVTSPIILDLDGNGVTTVAAADSKALYDLDGDGLADDTSWIGNTEGFLFLDRDGNGTVSNAKEFSFIDDVPGATSDLAGLKAFDSNKDGRLSSADARFAEFRVWRDADGDGAVDTGEVLSLASAGVASINLTGTAVNATTQLGEVAVLNRGSYTRTNGATMQFIDASLTYFSTALNPSELAERSYSFAQKDSKFRIAISGGAMTVGFKKPKGAVDPAAGQLGANVTMSFKNKTIGMLAPVVLDLDGNGVNLVSIKKAKAAFDMNGDGSLDDTGWIGRGDGFLVVDRNKDGLITEASELSLASEDEASTSGLDGLALFDSNGDGVVDKKDARFGELSVWVDANGNGVSEAGELRTLTEAGIASLRLRATAAPDRMIKLGDNAVLATASFTRSNGTTGTVGDVALAYKPGTAPTEEMNVLSAMRGASAGRTQELGELGVESALGAAIDLLTQTAGTKPLGIFDLPSDGAAFDRFALGNFAATASFAYGEATGKQATQDLPTSAVSSDDPSLDRFFQMRRGGSGLGLDSGQLLALIRQEMAAFGPAPMDDGGIWKRDGTYGIQNYWA